MKLVIAGGSGFLGTPLSERLSSAGHEIVVLTRRADSTVRRGWARPVTWHPDGKIPAKGSWNDWPSEIDGADAIVNLAGAGIADRRWSGPRKHELRSSRILSTRSLVTAVRAASKRPTVFIQGSAVGYYGSSLSDEVLDESFPPGSDFLGTLCVDWEAEALGAASLGCRLVTIRTAIVLARDSDVLKRMGPPFRLFVGGPIASGQQYFSWVHRDDWIALVLWALQTPSVSGVYNGSAPNPVTNAEFSRALGRALHRPSWLPVPAFALRLLVGEVADQLVNGQRMIPKRAMDQGFAFQHSTIDDALRAALKT